MGCKVGSSETRRGLRREEKGVRPWRWKKRDDCVFGTHTGVGLDSFIGRAAHRGERGREEERKEAALENAGSGGCEEREKAHDEEEDEGDPCVAQFAGPMGKMRRAARARESVKNQFAAHYAIRGTRVCLPRQTGI